MSQNPPTDHLLGTSRDSGLGFAFGIRSNQELPEAVFVDLVNQRQLRHARFERFSLADTARPIDALSHEKVIASRQTDALYWSVIELATDVLAYAEIRRGSAQVELAATDPTVLQAHCESLGSRIGSAETDPEQVPITFWAQGSHGPRSARRRIKAPDWSDIAANYERETGLAIARLITARIPDDGRLMLWHGAPGTGKTSALRALARVWSDWCSTHFITDPESFLGSGTSYMLDVLTSGGVSARDPGAAAWKMVVLEDSGELLAADAHERTGQALSRLLNITDGLIGQGMQVVVLVTTNEPLGRMHPAIQREGRCWREIEFMPLPAREANLWLASHDSAHRSATPMAIADLYAVLRGRSQQKVRPSFGFGAA
jgi:hypothetical protein